MGGCGGGRRGYPFDRLPNHQYRPLSPLPYNPASRTRYRGTGYCPSSCLYFKGPMRISRCGVHMRLPDPPLTSYLQPPTHPLGTGYYFPIGQVKKSPSATPRKTHRQSLKNALYHPTATTPPPHSPMITKYFAKVSIRFNPFGPEGTYPIFSPSLPILSG